MRIETEKNQPVPVRSPFLRDPAWNTAHSNRYEYNRKQRTESKQYELRNISYYNRTQSSQTRICYSDNTDEYGYYRGIGGIEAGYNNHYFSADKN